MIISASVVIPTYKRPELLINCLHSLIRQSVNPACYEIIVVTDGPDKQTINAVKRIRATLVNNPMIRVLSLPEHKGPAAARNLGWRIARGRLVIFTDDDCLPSANFVEAYLERFREHYWPCSAFTGAVKVPVSDTPTDYEKNISQLENASFITANCAISMQALELTGGFDEDFTMAWREDSAMEFCLIKHNIPITFVPRAVVLHPVRQASWTVSLRSEKKNMFNALLYKKYSNLYRDKIKEKPPLLYYAIVVSVLAIITSAVLSPTVIFMAILCWLLLTAILVIKRLKGTSRSFSHIFQIVVTSLAIPTLSVFWNTYGCIRYKSLLL